ncbi:ShlB/FhaC/HecB family hemolysin secretion/activation protein [Candidatus Thiosymbion oneisti]|uniref:ShlB/FhaC/HecB family hemolysin secretion/activation protein n=1 Tax=Candidatus Thiosymbion oneisti TaxID=589554 RepID=UPI000B7DF52B|nr:ShlB/FhaC/HecB family hemolysin secretion/activation protein [Candidatus Thiosymbion oneisti]
MVRFLKTFALCLGCGGSCFSVAVSAPATVPGSIDPGKVSARFPTRPEPTSTVVEPAAPPGTELPIVDAQRQRFDLQQIRIVGSSLYSPERLAGLTQPLVAQRRVSVADILGLVQVLRAQYQADGYTLVQIRRPLFGFDGEGYIVRIEVVEGYVEDLVLPQGRSETQRTLYRRYAAKLQADRPLSDRVYHRYSALAKDAPGGGVSLVLSPGTQAGALRLLIEPPRQQRLRSFMHIDNRGTEEYGPYQFTLGTQIPNPLRANDQLDLAYSGTVEFNELHYFAAAYTRALNAEGTVVSVSGTYNDGDPGTEILNRLDYRSEGYSLGLGLKHPVVRGLDFSTWVSGGYRYQDFRSDILATPNTRDRLSFFNLGVSVDWADAAFFGKAARNLLTTTLFQGVDGLGSTDNDNRFASRADGRVDFTRFTLNWYRSQQLSGRLAATLNLHGQYAATPVLSSQECAYGGAIFGRGFEPSALFGDHCTLGSLELSYAPDSPASQIGNPQLFGFVDYGKLWQRGSDVEVEGASVGAGVRMQLFDRVSTQVEVARGDSAVIKDDGWAVFFSVKIRH